MPSNNTITQVKRSAAEPLRDQVLQRCRLMLLCGHVVPGQKLPLRPLAEEFKTSLMPVRDALNRLVADGALELSSSRTICVPKMTEKRLHELHEIRSSLEGNAAAYATPNLTNKCIDRMQGLTDEMLQYLAERDYTGYLNSHYSFHFLLYGAAERPTLLGMIDMLWLQVGPWFRQGIEDASQTPGNPNAWHEDIITALRARDAVAVRTAIENDAFASIKYFGTGVWGEMPDGDRDIPAP